MREQMALYVGNSLTALNAKLADGWEIYTNYTVGKKTMFLLQRYIPESVPVRLGQEAGLSNGGTTTARDPAPAISGSYYSR